MPKIPQWKKEETVEYREKRLEKRRLYYQHHKDQWQKYEKQHREELNLKSRERRKKEKSHQSRLKTERKWKIHNPLKMKQARKNWANRNKDHMRELLRKWEQKEPMKKIVHNHARYLKAQSKCEICDSKEKLQKHHPDYDEPEVIVTLCKECHTEVTLDDLGIQRIETYGET